MLNPEVIRSHWLVLPPPAGAAAASLCARSGAAINSAAVPRRIIIANLLFIANLLSHFGRQRQSCNQPSGRRRLLLAVDYSHFVFTRMGFVMCFLDGP